MLSLWLVLLCSTTPISSPTMVDNRFSGESPDEIYSGAFAQRLLVGIENVSPQRSLLISVLNLSAPVEPPGDAASFSSSRSFHWSDLLFHWFLTQSTTQCSMNTLCTGKNCSNLLWCERGIISSGFISDLAIVECFCGSAQDDKSLQALMATPFVDSRNLLPPPLIYYVLCIKEHPLEHSEASQSVSSNIPWSGVALFRYRSISDSSFSGHYSIPYPSLRCVRLDPNSPLKLFFVDKISQISSRQGRERSFSISSFSKERTIPPKSLFLRVDSLPESKTGKIYKFSDRLLSYVMVHLRPVDATNLIHMRVEVSDDTSTSQTSVTNRLYFEEIEVRCKSFIDWIASANFVILYNVLSSFLKFVSLSLYCFELYVRDLAVWLAHRGLYDVATTIVIV